MNHQPTPHRAAGPGPGRLVQTAWILSVLALCILLVRVLKRSDWYRAHAIDWPRDARYMVQPVIWAVLLTITILLARRCSASARHATLGLLIGWRRAMHGAAIGLACASPMLALGLLAPRREITHEIIQGTLVAGLSEEILFRGFAFGFLVQLARWRVWPAAILTGAVFGALHIDWGSSIAPQLGWVSFIGLGGVLYAWIHARSGWNLWIPIALHTAMNLWWAYFDLNATPLGPTGATLARVLCVTLVIVIVLRHTRDRTTEHRAPSTLAP